MYERRRAQRVRIRETRRLWLSGAAVVFAVLVVL